MHIAWLAPHLEAEFAAYRLAEGVTGGLVVIAGSRSAAARRVESRRETKDGIGEVSAGSVMAEMVERVRKM